VRSSHPHAEPYKIAGYYYYHAHSYAARALRRLAAREKTPSPARAARVRELLAALVAEQDADGAWMDAPCGDRPYATALAVLELTDLRELLFPWAANLDDAVAAARERSAPVVVLFTDGGKASAKAEEALQDADLLPVRDACLWVRVPKAGTDEVWKAAKVSSGGSVLVLSAAGEWSTAAPAARFGSSVSAKLLLRAIRRVLPAEGGK